MASWRGGSKSEVEGGGQYGACDGFDFPPRRGLAQAVAHSHPHLQGQPQAASPGAGHFGLAQAHGGVIIKRRFSMQVYRDLVASSRAAGQRPPRKEKFRIGSIGHVQCGGEFIRSVAGVRLTQTAALAGKRRVRDCGRSSWGGQLDLYFNKALTQGLAAVPPVPLPEVRAAVRHAAQGWRQLRRSMRSCASA